MLPRLERGQVLPVSDLEWWVNDVGRLRCGQVQLDQKMRQARSDIAEFFRGERVLLTEVERFWSASAYLAAVSPEIIDFPSVLYNSLGVKGHDIYQSLLPYYGVVLRQNPHNECCFQDPRLSLVDSVVRHTLGYGMWRALEISRRTSEEGYDKPLRHVGAVGMNRRGEILAEGHRGQAGVRSRHAEENMLINLHRTGRESELFFAATNLEPCLERSQRHECMLGHRKGCSQLLLEAGVGFVGYLNTDLGESGKGRGASYLTDNGVVVFAADHPVAIELGMHANGHFDDFKQRLIMLRDDK